MDMSFYTFKYALIKEGKVENIIMVDSYPTAQQVAQAQGYTEPAVCVDQYLVTIGDTYANGIFTHAGDEVQRQMTLQEENTTLKAQLATAQATIDQLVISSLT